MNGRAAPALLPPVAITIALSAPQLEIKASEKMQPVAQSILVRFAYLGVLDHPILP